MQLQIYIKIGKSNTKLVAVAQAICYDLPKAQAENLPGQKGRLIMQFSENIQFLRKQKGMTQEELAEQMAVSRQTVSKWESDQSFPETDKLIALCDLFGCSMDALLRGDVRESFLEDSTGYDRHQNRFTISICSGVACVLFGVFALVFSYGMFWSETISVLLFFAFLVAAVAVFIVAGLSHGNFVKEHPSIQPFYTDAQIRAFNRRFPLFIVLPTVLILFGVMWIIAAGELAPSALAIEKWEYIYSSIFFLFLTAAVPMYVYGGMQKAKYNVEDYNKENSQDPETVRRKNVVGRVQAILMLVATIVFLLLGFLGNYWYIAWVVYPVAALLCAVVSVIAEKSA